MNKRVFAFKRFSLRALLLLTTVCCVALALWTNAVKPFRDQQAALGVVNRLNGASRSEPLAGSGWWRWLVEHAAGEGAFVSVVDVDLRGATFLPGEARRLAGFTRVRNLTLDKSTVVDDDLAALAAMREIETLGLRYCQVSDEGLARVGGKPHLRELHLTGCDVSDASIDLIASCPSLKLLMVRWTNLSPAGVERLAERLPNCTIAYQPLTAE